MHIRMYESGDFVFIPENLPEESQGNRHRPASVVFIEHHSVRDTAAPGHPLQCLDGIGVPYDTLEFHLSLPAVNAAIETR